MIAALTTAKNVLDPYVMQLDGPARAFSAGQSIYRYYWIVKNAKSRDAELEDNPYYSLIQENVEVLSLVVEANRLKIFKGTCWQKLFSCSAVGLTIINAVVFISCCVELPQSLIRISKAAWGLEPAVKGLTRMVLAIFAFHRRPREAAFCLLGGSLISQGFSAAASKIQHCAIGVKFYVGSGYERIVILTQITFFLFFKI